MDDEAIERESNSNYLEKVKPKGYKRNKNSRNNKNNDIKSQIEKPKTVNILGDSMMKKLNGYLLTIK